MSRDFPLRDRAEMLIPPLPWDRPRWRDRGGPRVVLLHGLWRGWHSMQPLARKLEEAGFSTFNLPYPSSRMEIPRLAAFLRTRIAQHLEGSGPIHFVTHSLGGILVRYLVHHGVSWKPGRLVMLAPPNRGSEIVDWAEHHRLLLALLGPAGRGLGSQGIPGSLPAFAPTAETAIIMGKRSNLPFFRRVLGQENDGIVSVSHGTLAETRCFAVVDADHTFIQRHPETVRLTLEFLRHGSWQQP